MMDFLTSQATVKNCIGWIFSPLMTVGSPTGSLETTFCGQDTASRNGSKHQSYTTWDCLSRQYLCGSVVVDKLERAKREVTPRMTERFQDVPTQEELDALTEMQRDLYHDGLRVFVRGKGLMTSQQHQKYLSSRLERSTRSPRKKRTQDQELASGSKTDEEHAAEDETPDRVKRDENENKFFYSDTIPVKCMGVSTMQCARETDPMPWSPTFQLMASRLNDPAATGVLAAVVKGPNVRDATAWTSLVKSIMLRQSTRYELAAMIRVLCMALSLADESYKLDPTPIRFIRNEHKVTYDGQVIREKPGFDAGEYQVIAMPIDVFIALANNSCFENAPHGFEYKDLDIGWTAVPVSSDIANFDTLIPYLAAFLTSDLWSGTVNQHYSIEYQSDNIRRRFDETWMPCVNSVNIPGQKRAALILIDETSMTTQNFVKLTTGQQFINVPIWKGNNNVVPVNWGNLWRAYWNTNNISKIRHTALLAHEKICTRMGVGDACGTAVSLVAELYGHWYHGIAPRYKAKTMAFDYDKVPYGAWTIDGDYLDKRKMFRSHKFTLDDPKCMEARRRCVAYNFSGVSPMHLSPTGLVKIAYVNDSERLRVTWAEQHPEFAATTYNIQTMSSIYRVAAACGLILTHTDSYAFGEVQGATHWIHMLSCAISFTTSSFLSINDLAPRDWIGIDNRDDTQHRESVMGGLKTALYGGLINHVNIEQYFGHIPEWDLDIMSEYYGVSAYNNINWMTFSPVPFHATWQWVCKLQLETGAPMPKGITTFKYNSKNYDCIKLTKECNEHKMNSVCAIDVYRRCPTVVAREPDANYVPILQWIDNVSRYSSVLLPEMSALVSREMYESMTFCAPIDNIGLAYSDKTTWYVYGSNYNSGDPIITGTKVSQILWPDPPTIDAMWNTAKNYILKPAASALVGFITGGPAGAAVSAGSTVVNQAINDLLSPKVREAQKNRPETTVVQDLEQKTLTKPQSKVEQGKTVELIPTTSENKMKPLTLNTTVKSTPTPAAETMVYKEPIKTLSVLDESPVNE
ncbi:capsid protein [Camponotus yamaokai virus]|uniref:Capsid protein n=1 Tax=Camponotus yamaokai virus TaxID=1608533 RepID=A0A0F7R4X8_9VIRU|nr:capsid protein [Camponotus yamaokai virus]BAR72204.1 capsid protein [Camponotus yamaokai virus]